MKRLDRIDILRAIGIILMVAGHVFTFFGKFDRYIHTFHMPLFFVISGYLFKSKPETKLFMLISQRAKRLLLPYVTFAGINYVAWFFLERGTEAWYGPLVRLVTYNTSGLPICGALWFLTALFWAEVFYLVFDRVIKRSGVRSVFVLAGAVAVSVVQNSTEIRLPLTIDTGFICMGFYEIGRLCKTYGGRVSEKINAVGLWKKILLGLALFLVNAVLAFVNPYVNIKSGWYGFVPLFWVNALIGILACYMLALVIDLHFKERNVLKKYLVTVGRGSIVFLGFNQVVIVCMELLFRKLPVSLNIWIVSGIIFALVMCVLQVLYLLFNKMKNKKLRMLFGI